MVWRLVGAEMCIIDSNHYVQYYTGTFQHGGISMEEMLVPLITLTPR